jgi:membrane associated rhomboid family serine protease
MRLERAFDLAGLTLGALLLVALLTAPLWRAGIADLWLHAGAMGLIAGWLSTRFARFSHPQLPAHRVWLGTILLCGALACADEWAQTFARSRTAEWADVGGDLLGALLGATFAALLHARRRPPSPEHEPAHDPSPPDPVAAPRADRLRGR